MPSNIKFTNQDLENIRATTKYLKPCSRVHHEWDWKQGIGAEQKFDESTNLNFDRNYFDCGNYYFDGIFNVVKFEKGMNLYHGSAMLADYVAEYPLGPDFYNTNDRILPGDLSKQEVMKDYNIQTALTTKHKISPSWYADLHIGEIYSGQIPDKTQQSLITNCTGKCINVYKAKKDIVLLLLDDEYNIAKLYTELEKKGLNAELAMLQQMFNIKGKNSIILTKDKNPFKRFQIDKDRISYRNVDLPFADFLMDNYIKPNGYSGYGATATASSFHGSEFHLEIILSNPPMIVERNLENPYDWQHPNKTPPEGLQEKFLNSMKLFKSYNTNFHSGDLLEHSVWSLLHTEKLLEGQKLFIPEYITNNENMKKIISFASLMHDIGKFHIDGEKNGVTFNDKTNTFVYQSVKLHPEYGYQMVMGKLPIKIYNKENNKVTQETVMFDDLFNAFLPDFVSDKIGYSLFVAYVIRNHWRFGDWLSTIKTSEISLQDCDKFLKMLKCVDGEQYNKYIEENKVLFVIGLIIVSLSDIYGTQPYGINRLSKSVVQELNKCSKYFNFCNRPKKYKGVDLLKLNGGENRVLQITNQLISCLVNMKQQYILCPQN
jgi:hypothetical protein